MQMIKSKYGEGKEIDYDALSRQVLGSEEKHHIAFDSMRRTQSQLRHVKKQIIIEDGLRLKSQDRVAYNKMNINIRKQLQNPTRTFYGVKSGNI